MFKSARSRAGARSRLELAHEARAVALHAISGGLPEGHRVIVALGHDRREPHGSEGAQVALALAQQRRRDALAPALGENRETVEVPPPAIAHGDQRADRGLLAVGDQEPLRVAAQQLREPLTRVRHARRAAGRAPQRQHGGDVPRAGTAYAPVAQARINSTPSAGYAAA